MISKSLLFGIGLALAMTACNNDGEAKLFNGTDLSGWHMDVPQRDTVPEALCPLWSEKATWSPWVNPGGI